MKIKVLYGDYQGETLDYSVVDAERDKSDPDYCEIDFEIRNAQDNTLMATVWGDKDSVEIDCEHYAVGMDDISECGVCEICGAKVHWHKDINYDDGYKSEDIVIDGYDPVDEIPKHSIIGLALKKRIK